MPKILLVDDDYSILIPIAKLLENNNYEVKTAKDGYEAMEVISSFKPDVIVTDVNMPKLDGWSLCEKLNEGPATKDIPVLVLTAKQGKMNEFMSYELGADAYLAKPFKDMEFLDVVKELLLQSKPDK